MNELSAETMETIAEDVRISLDEIKRIGANQYIQKKLKLMGMLMLLTPNVRNLLTDAYTKEINNQIYDQRSAVGNNR